MDDFESRVKKAVSETNGIITCPDPNLIISAAKTEIHRHRLPIKKSVKISIAILAAAMAVLMTGMISFQYMFADGNHSFGSAQDEGYVNVYRDRYIMQDNITVKPIAILSDGITTYVRLSIDGLSSDDYKDIVSIGEKNINLNTKGILSHINDAILSDNNGNKWNYKIQKVHSSKSSAGYATNPTLISKNLKKNEVVLTFYGAPKNTSAIFNLELALKDSEKPFVFKDLNAKIAPIVVKDMKNNNLEYSIPGAKATIQSISYTVLQTNIKIEWTIDPQKIQDISDYCYKYVYIIREADKKVSINASKPTKGVILHPAFLPGYSPENLKAGNTTFVDEIVIPTINHKKDIIIDVYDKTKTGYVFIKELLVIPANN